jgi:hypothetical protein
MTTPGPRYSKEEYARRGDTIYQRDILPHLKPEDKDKFVAIDIETGEYEIDADDDTVGDDILERNPNAQLWIVRVGHRASMTIRARIPRGVSEW